MDDLRETLREQFGLEDFRPAQREVIADVLAGRDVLCVMPTGAGKSLCYQLPAVVLGKREEGGVTIVVSPLISLMEDQVNHLSDEGIPAVLLASSQGAARQREVMRELASGFSGLVYVAPERFYTAGFSNLLPQLKVNLFAVDEAHCISQWGHDFRPEYGMLGDVRARLNEAKAARGEQGGVATIALTATATHDVRQDIIRQLALPDPSVYVTGFDRPNLRYAAERIESKGSEEAKLGRIIDLLRQQSPPASTIIYCSTRKAVDEVTLRLRGALRGRKVVPYHAGMSADDRTASQEAFMNADDVIAVCTNAFGMGVNKPDTRLVIHYAIPGTLEAYYQEAGRAGRDGLPADCILLYCWIDRKTQEFFISKIGEPPRGGGGGDDDGRFELSAEQIKERKAYATDKLDQITEYASTHRCRRQAILDYFGEQSVIDGLTCACDVCRKGRLDPDAAAPTVALLPDATVTLVRQLLAGVARASQVAAGYGGVGGGVGGFGVTTIADMLTGSDPERLERLGLARLSTCGLLKHLSTKPVVAMLHRLMEAGLARQKNPPGLPTGHARPVMELTLTGIAVMKGTRPPPASLIDLTGRPPAPRGRSRASGALVAGRAREPLTEQDAHHTPLDDDAQGRFERLRAARAAIAREQGVPPYVVAHDKTLRLLALHPPGSLEELANTKGFGKSRAEKYGDGLLRAMDSTPPNYD